jgi:AAA15 family ATPase/GTPase
MDSPPLLPTTPLNTIDDVDLLKMMTSPDMMKNELQTRRLVLYWKGDRGELGRGQGETIVRTVSRIIQKQDEINEAVDEIRKKKSNQNALNTKIKHALEHPSKKVSREEVTQQMAELSLQNENAEDVKTAKKNEEDIKTAEDSLAGKLAEIREGFGTLDRIIYE